MSAAGPPSPPAPPVLPGAGPVGAAAGGQAAGFAWPRFAGVLRSEWTKIRSVRSTAWTLSVTAVLMVGVAVLLGALSAHFWEDMSAEELAAFDATELSLSGLILAQLAVVTLGVLVVTTEYRSGMIRLTFAALPRRREVLAAKCAVFAAVSFGVGLVAAFGAFLAAQWTLAGVGADAGLGDPGVLRAIVGCAVVVSLTGLLGLALGTLLRHSAGAITTMVGLLFVVPIILAVIPGGWKDPLLPYYLSNTANRVITTNPTPEDLDLANALGPWAGLGVLALWVAVALAAAAFVLDRRDA